MNVFNYIFYERKMSQPKYHWVEKKYLGTPQQTFVLMKTSWRRLSSLSSDDVFKTSSRRFQDIFKTSSRCFEDVFKTSSRPLQGVFKMSSRHLQDVLQRYLQDIFKAYHQVNLFYLIRPREVFNMFLSTEEFA